MHAMLQLQADRDAVARWITAVTMQMRQEHSQDQYVPTPWQDKAWDYETNSYTGLVRVQISVAPPDEPLPRCPETLPEDEELIAFYLDQLPPGVTSMVIHYHEEHQERIPEMLGYLREYLRLIAKVWPPTHDDLRKQYGDAGWVRIAELLESVPAVDPPHQTPNTGILAEPEPEPQPEKPHRDSGHFSFGPAKRREIVEHYRRDRGTILNKAVWASQQYGISGRTLLAYEKEFSEET